MPSEPMYARPRGDARKGALGSRASRGEWKVIVAGCGRVGAQLSEMLSLDGFQVTVVDQDSKAFERLSKTFQGQAVTGLAFDLDTLEAGGGGGAISAPGSPSARLYNPDKEQTFQALGIDYFCGTTILAEMFMQGLVKKRVKILSWAANNRVLLVEFECPDRFAGKQVSKLEREELLRVGLVTHDGRTVVATKQTKMHRGDRIIAAVIAGRLNRVRRMVETNWTLGVKTRRRKEAIPRSS